MNNSKARFIVITLGFVFGLANLLITPPFQSPDARVHFYKAYSVSKFVVIGTKTDSLSGDYIPKEYISMANDLLGNIPANTENKFQLSKIKAYNYSNYNLKDTKLQDFRNSVYYSPFAYLPQAFGLLIARKLKVPLFMHIYICRILNLLVFLLILYYSSKVLDSYIYSIFILLLMPTSLFLASTLSPDAFIIALSTLSITIFIRISIYQHRVTNSFLFLLLLITIILGLTKHVYILSNLLIFTIPKINFKNSKARLFWIISFLVLPITFSIIWATTVKELFLPCYAYINPEEQLQYIISNPLSFLKAILISLTMIPKYITMAIGTFGWNDSSLNSHTIVIYMIAICVITLTEASKTKMTNNLKYQSLLILFLGYLAIHFLLYLSWNPVGNSYISGIQGRYFLPFVALLLPIFRIKSLNLHFSNYLPMLTIFTIAAFNILTLHTLIQRYY